MVLFPTLKKSLKKAAANALTKASYISSISKG
jgi:hypothetical protein